MKKILIIMLFISIISGIAAAESYDFSTMDFEQLSNLKSDIDKEYLARPEAGEFPLYEGYYIIGQDIKEGAYYIGTWQFGYSTLRKHIQHADTYLQFDFTYPGDIKHISFIDGDDFWIQGSPLIISKQPIKEPVYDTPEGTRLTEGKYYVSTDVPSGKYYISAATIMGGEIIVFATEEEYQEYEYYSALDYEVAGASKGERIVLDINNNYKAITVSEGNVLIVQRDIILQEEKEVESSSRFSN